MLVQVNEDEYQAIYQSLIDNNDQKNHYFGIITSLIAIHESREMNYNQQYCEEHNIKILHNNRYGETIVAFSGDIDFFFIQNENKIPKEINCLLQYLRFNKKLVANIDESMMLIGRDILIDDTYKVATFTNTEYNGVVFTAGHISMSVDLDEIKNICLKPMKKIPKGLTEYGITQQEIIDLIRQANDEV